EGPTLSGTLAARDEATVRAEVAGQVRATYADEGVAVEKGAVLARIDPGALVTGSASAATAVRSARATLGTTQKQAGRQEELSRAGIVSRQDVEIARQAVDTARAQLAQAQAQAGNASEQLERATVHAPLAGTVSQRSVSAGDVVQVGAALFTVVDN